MRILLAVDGSRSSDQARDLVAALPLHDGSVVRILSVAPTRADLMGVPWTIETVPDVDEIEEEVLKTHREAVDQAEREIRSARCDLVVEPILSRGRAASVIVDEAHAMAADLIVVGHRGHSRWESILLGSVSSEVVDHAPCPVLVARDERLGPVVLADDGSSFARAAEALLTSWPMFDGLPIRVVTVAEDGFPYATAVAPLVYTGAMQEYALSVAEARRSTAAESEAAAARLRSAGLEATAEVREGDPAQQIIAGAAQLGAGLIVVGTRGRTGLRRILLGSVGRRVLLHAPCSVLVVRDRVAMAPNERDREVVGAFG